MKGHVNTQALIRATIVALLAVALSAPPAGEAQAQSRPDGEGGGRSKAKPGGEGRRGKGPPPGAQGSVNPTGEFNAASFMCFEYTSASGENATNRAQGLIARVSIEGNIAGLNQARQNLKLSAEAIDRDAMAAKIAQTCADRPTASILSIGMTDKGEDALAIPATIVPGLALDSYTCAQHAKDRKGSAGDAVKADIADLWVFSFIQGFKLASNTELIIPIQNKPVLVGAVAKSCAAQPSVRFLDVTAQVAEKVKIQ